MTESVVSAISDSWRAEAPAFADIEPHSLGTDRFLLLDVPKFVSGSIKRNI